MPGFFVADPDYRLPHPRIPLRVILVIHLALTKAFQLLRTQPPAGFVLLTAKEDEITLELYRVLEDRLLGGNVIAGFDRRRFRNVVRAPEVPNYDGTHPAKKPDVVMFLMEREHLSVRPSQDALFAECKPVGGNLLGRHTGGQLGEGADVRQEDHTIDIARLAIRAPRCEQAVCGGGRYVSAELRKQHLLVAASECALTGRLRQFGGELAQQVPAEGGIRKEQFRHVSLQYQRSNHALRSHCGASVSLVDEGLFADDRVRTPRDQMHPGRQKCIPAHARSERDDWPDPPGGTGAFHPGRNAASPG